MSEDALLPVLPPRFGKVRCPRCGASLRLPETSSGRKVKCPTCNYKWRNGGKPITPSTDALRLPDEDSLATPPPDLPLDDLRNTPPPPAAPAKKDDTVTARPAPAWFAKPTGPEFEPIDCSVRSADTATGVEDRWDGLIYHEGLLLSRGDQRHLIPVGTVADYDGDNALRVEWQGRAWNLKLYRPNTATNTLTFQLVKFLNRQVEALDLEDHLRPTLLYLLGLLPLGLVPLSGFSLLWSGLAVVLILACLGLARARSVPHLSRLIGVAGLAFIGYFVWGLVELPVLLQGTPPAASPVASRPPS